MKNATAKSSTHTLVRHQTAQALARAITHATNPRAECLGASFVTGAVETRLETEASAGSSTDPIVSIFGLRTPKTCPGRIGILLPL